MEKFILASSSPRRRELLEQVGLKFDILVTNADENGVDKSLPINLYVEELALVKATEACRALKNQGVKDGIIIAADTIVYKDKKIIGKPRDEEDAFNILKDLSGNSHDVVTGISVMRIRDGFAYSDCETTRVVFKALSDEEINRYITTKEPMDKAGAYGIQGKGAVLVERIDGDYNNVVGLPISKLADILKKEFEIEIF